MVHASTATALYLHITCVLYLICFAELREADPESSHRKSRTADESTDYLADIQRNNQVG